MFKDNLVEGVDFYWDEVGGFRYRVFTEKYLLKTKDSCCGNNCRHCPWNKKDKK